MRKRFNLLPTYHFEENTDGQIRGAAERVLRDCTIYGNCGKNLLPYPFKDTTKTINGITFTDNGDGTVTANGTATDTTQFFPKESSNGPLLAPGTYTFSGCPEGGDWKTYCIRLTGFAADRDFGNGSTFTLTQATKVGLALTVSSGVTVENLVFKPQIESGSTKTDYEPYKEVGDYDAESGKYILPVTVSGKNLISYPYSMATKTANGITFTDNGDGTVTANGTATAAAVFVCKYYNAKTPIVPDKKIYFLSGCPEGGRTSASVWNYRINAMTYKEDSYVGGYSDFGDGKTVDLRNVDFDTLQVQILINNGASVDNLVFKPQLELGETATDYEPYTAPKTTNLLLDAPLGPGESISCREKGLLVPELATTDPRITNYITFGSEVKPSSANFDYYKY